MQQPNRSNVRWEWIGQGWELFTKQWQTWVLSFLIFFGAILVCYFSFALIIGIAGGLSSRGGFGYQPVFTPFVILFLLILVIVVLFIVAFLTTGLYKMAFKQIRGEALSVADLFSGGDCFLRVLGIMVLLLIVSLLANLIIGLPARIIPLLTPITFLLSLAVSLTISGLLYFAIPLVIERNLGIAEAITQSINATRSQLPMYAVFAFVVQFLSGIGLLGCCVGILGTAHFPFTIGVNAFRDVFGLPGIQDNNSYNPPPPPIYGGYEPPPPPSSWQ